MDHKVLLALRVLQEIQVPWVRKALPETLVLWVCKDL